MMRAQLARWLFPEALTPRDLEVLDVETAIHHLRGDLRDDWFPDPVDWEDLLAPEYLRSTLFQAALPLGFLKSHTPLEKHVRDVPKANGTLRYSLEQTLVDRFVYQLIASDLAPDLDLLLSPRVLSHRLRQAKGPKKRPKRFFRSGVEQWGHFGRMVYGDNGKHKHIVEADIQTFFESITLEVISRALSDAISEAAVSRARRKRMRRLSIILLRNLKEWTFLRTQGLPQNRDASSFLANLVMRDVDNWMIRNGHDYYRYMDDIRIKCETHSEARKALAQLCIRLRLIGLSLNSAKTRINAPGSEWHREQARPKDTRMRDIDNMWRSRSPQLVARSLKYLADLAADVISAGEVDSRQFRFLVNRIERIIRCPDISWTLPRAEELRALAIKSLRKFGHASDQTCKLIELLGPTPEEIVTIENLLLGKRAGDEADQDHGTVEEREFLHDWQKFQITRMLIRLSATTPRFIRMARSVLEGSSDTIPLDAAVLALGFKGEDQDRRRIAQLYRSRLSHTPFLQRAALIAIHNLDYDRELSEHLRRSVVPHLRGSLRRYKSRFSGTFFAPPKQFRLSDFANIVDRYVG